MKESPISLVIREIQMKTPPDAMLYPLRAIENKKGKLSVGEDTEKSDPSCITGGNVKWYNHCGSVWQFLEKLTIELSHGPATPVLGIYTK